MNGIWVGNLKLNGVGEASSVSVGPNLIFGVHAASKSVSGHAWVSGDYSVLPTTNGFFDDTDLIDSPVWHYMGSPRA